jgi:protein SCO1
MSGTIPSWVRTLAVCGVLVLTQTDALADDTASERHAHAARRTTISTTQQYAIPQVRLIRDDGVGVLLPAEMDDGRPVVVNFIFTTCGSICPLMSQVFGQFQRKLDTDARQPHLLSISTDPEEDTPGKLRQYAQRFGARDGWNHYTGTVEASQSAQRAFDVYRGDKMSHTPVTLMRAAPGRPWLRIEGFLTPDELLQRYRQLLSTG